MEKYKPFKWILSAKKIMKLEDDSLIIFSSRTEKFLDKQIIGKELSSTNNYLWSDCRWMCFFVFWVRKKRRRDLWHIENQHINKLSMIGVFHIFEDRQPAYSKNGVYFLFTGW